MCSIHGILAELREPTASKYDMGDKFERLVYLPPHDGTLY